MISHGYLRLTLDVDLIIDLERDNLLRGLDALRELGYVPRLPIENDQFAEEQTRERWIVEKNMLVFPLWNPSDINGVSIDVFVKCPSDFDAEYEKAKWTDMEDGCKVPFVGVDCLLRMKKEAARPKDLIDIEYLQRARDGNAE